MEILEEIYLPFTEGDLLKHCVKVKNNKGKCEKNEKFLDYYRKSLKKYKEFKQQNLQHIGLPISKVKHPCQIEKDERFWTAATFMTIFHNPHTNTLDELSKILTKAYGKVPPINAVQSWEECLEGELYLYFEANLPSSQSYKKWLQEQYSYCYNVSRRYADCPVHLIPYVINSSGKPYEKNGFVLKKTLEGASVIDALIVNPSNGFSVLIEAKVLSDISCDVTYDIRRNQIARLLDVMLERNDSLCYPLNKRDPEKTLFLLVTPKIFRDNPHYRFYGYKFLEYKNNPQSINRDLPYRNYDFVSLSSRMGWISWEEIKSVNQECCKWLERQINI